ncbi:hypothetical protein NE237_001457 [Protea cynaroides]|uniref:Uncharacterized protein n=1 Tax=Protea cynaroides TaxID=273540 RepID=A0A9Q0KU09_9MAGN|nr:hypothetical protein NE237_001457 [Protea cynaroides]
MFALFLTHTKDLVALMHNRTTEVEGFVETLSSKLKAIEEARDEAKEWATVAAEVRAVENYMANDDLKTIMATLVKMLPLALAKSRDFVWPVALPPSSQQASRGALPYGFELVTVEMSTMEVPDQGNLVKSTYLSTKPLPSNSQDATNLPTDPQDHGA